MLLIFRGLAELVSLSFYETQYEHLTTCRALGYGFVIRSGQDRAVVDAEERAQGGRWYETVRAAACLGRFTVELPARQGTGTRIATLAGSACPVRLRSPQRPGAGIGKLPPVPCTVVRVWEEQPSTPGEALEWILLCDAPVQSLAQAYTCALQYATRWVIEEYHKALKTDLGAERLQFAMAARLFAAVAILSIVALRLVGLREQVWCESEGRTQLGAPTKRRGIFTTSDLIVDVKKWQVFYKLSSDNHQCIRVMLAAL